MENHVGILVPSIYPIILKVSLQTKYIMIFINNLGLTAGRGSPLYHRGDSLYLDQYS